MEKSEDNSQVNDLLFKELIKNGYSLEGRTRVWNIADSKLWYLTAEQMKLSEELDKDPIFKRNNDDELKLFDEDLQDIKKELNQPFNFIDLGFNGAKVIEILRKLSAFGVPFNYCPLDVNPLMLTRAKELFSQAKDLSDKKVGFVELQGDFANLDTILAKLKKTHYKKNVIFLSRDVFVNLDPNEILYHIRTSIGKEDALILTSSIYGRSWSKRAKNYLAGSKLDLFAAKNLELLGIPRKDTSFEVRFKNSRLEMVYTLKMNKEIVHDGKKVVLKKGDKVLVIFSYKHFKEDLLTYLNINFGEVNTVVSHNKLYILALCKTRMEHIDL